MLDPSKNNIIVKEIFCSGSNATSPFTIILKNFSIFCDVIGIKQNDGR